MAKKTKKTFKPHMMYSKSGAPKMASTYESHMALKKKGYGHTKPTTKKTTKKRSKKSGY
jgi:hypothetical protein